MNMTIVKTACSLLIAFSFCSQAVASEPILDVTVQANGKASDESNFHRVLKMRKPSAGSGNESVLFQSNTAITLPFEGEDPLFMTGACTWMIRCRVSEIHPTDSYLIAGRWEGRDDQRIMMLSIGQKVGRAMFQVSSAGGLSGRGVAKTEAAVPPGEWVTIVGRFEPGSSLGVKLFNESGELIDEASVMSNVPGDLPNMPIPFSIGRTIPAEMEFSRFRVWNSALADDEIKTAVTGM